MVRKLGIISSITLLFLVFSTNSIKKSINTLEKVFYYAAHSEIAGKAPEAADIDLGRIVLFFKKKPVVNLVPSVASKQKTADVSVKKDVFIFPLSDLKTADSKKMVKKLNAAQNRFYKFHLEPVVKPIAGLKLVITYDPALVSFDHRFFETISLSKGVEFRFYNKGLINKLGKRLSSSTRVSCLKKKVDCH